MFFTNQREKALTILNELGLPMDNKNYWWFEFPKRAVEEIYKMDQNTNAVMNVQGKKIVWEEEITNNFGSRFCLSIETKPGFPFKAPKVFVKSSDLHYRKNHVNADGSLCLFKPEEYSSSMSVLEIRGMACAWCFCIEAYKETEVWPGAEAPHF